jgi:hypothetical protein
MAMCTHPHVCSTCGGNHRHFEMHKVSAQDRLDSQHKAICKRFNRPAGCYRKGEVRECHYSHICIKCRGAHSAVDCAVDVCRQWNQGSCPRGTSCPHSHLCIACGEHHTATEGSPSCREHPTVVEGRQRHYCQRYNSNDGCGEHPCSFPHFCNLCGGNHSAVECAVVNESTKTAAAHYTFAREPPQSVAFLSSSASPWSSTAAAAVGGAPLVTCAAFNKNGSCARSSRGETCPRSHVCESCHGSHPLIDCTSHHASDPSTPDRSQGAKRPRRNSSLQPVPVLVLRPPAQEKPRTSTTENDASDLPPLETVARRDDPHTTRAMASNGEPNDRLATSAREARGERASDRDRGDRPLDDRRSARAREDRAEQPASDRGRERDGALDDRNRNRDHDSGRERERERELRLEREREARDAPRLRGNESRRRSPLARDMVTTSTASSSSASRDVVSLVSTSSKNRRNEEREKRAAGEHASVSHEGSPLSKRPRASDSSPRGASDSFSSNNELRFQTEACMKWNWHGNCTFSDEKCHRKHVCSECCENHTARSRHPVPVCVDFNSAYGCPRITGCFWQHVCLGEGCGGPHSLKDCPNVGAAKPRVARRESDGARAVAAPLPDASENKGSSTSSPLKRDRSHETVKQQDVSTPPGLHCALCGCVSACCQPLTHVSLLPHQHQHQHHRLLPLLS